MRKGEIKLGFLLIFFCAFTVNAQGTLKEYRKAAEVKSLFAENVFNAPRQFHWIENDLLWYVNNTRDGKQHLLVDPEDREQKVAFDHIKLAGSLSELLGRKIAEHEIEIEDLSVDREKAIFTFTIDSSRISGNFVDYELEVIDSIKKEERRRGYWGNGFDERDNPPVVSHDKSLTAYIKNSNVYIKDNVTQEESRLSYDGSEGFFYSSYLQWSPDGKKIMAYKVRPGQEHKIHFVESSPSDQLQPKLHSRDYLKPGDELAFKSPQLFRVDTEEHILIPTDLFDSQYSISNIKWKENSSAFTFEYNQRGHQVYRVLKIDSEDGEIHTLIEETSPTFIDYSGKNFRHDINDGKEIIWASERDGWNHLYLFDGKTGELKKQITSGNWPVRDVVEIDEENRQIYFAASGMDKDQDPYFIHYFRIDFNGKNLTRFTTENANHKVVFSPDYKYYTDQYSRIDMPPVTLLKKTSNQKQIMKLQEGDISDLMTSGWQIPEPFKAKGRDGETDIWGMIVRPTSFDPQKEYPVIEYIYAGPHSSFVPKSFNSYYGGITSLAELGFIVVQIDGMGTSNRSKEFHDVAWKNLKDAGFPDRKIWIRSASEKYPYMDIDKVGIHGTSAGGQSAGGALVFNSDFYDVAVASCGCHDNRMDKIWWNEQWMGYPVGPEYAECSNIENAAQLEGNLMLIVGEVDSNVDPASTFQFADALIKADKDFELVVIPGAGHTSGGEFGERKRKDFFVKHLMGITPPSWNKIYDQKENPVDQVN